VTPLNKAGALVLKARDSKATLAQKQEAFCELVRLFQDMAYAAGYAVLGDSCLAEDAAQEAFISAWQKLSQLQQPEAFPGWFRRIVLTECNRFIRKQHLRTISLDEGMDVQASDLHPQLAIEKDELTKTAIAATNKLSLNERMVVVLFYVNEHSQSEIGAFLNVPLTTVAKRLYSARMRLRAMMMDGVKNDLIAHRPSRDESFAEKVKAGIYDEYIGQYKFELRPDLVVTISREGEHLIGEAAGQRNLLFARDATRSELLTSEFDGRGEFVRNEAGQISHLIYYEFGTEMGVAKKIC
jgi:RNA polymerase sigma factor (sigma-70 family)